MANAKVQRIQGPWFYRDKPLDYVAYFGPRQEMAREPAEHLKRRGHWLYLLSGKPHDTTRMLVRMADKVNEHR